VDKKLLQKFKAGKCTPDEVRKILLWFQSEQAEASYSVEIDNLWHREDEFILSNKDKLFKLILDRINNLDHSAGSKEHVHQRAPLPRRQDFKTNKFLKLAVTFVLLLITSGILYFFQPRLFQQQQPATESKILSKKINQGQKYTMKLSDGTIVKLNSGSSIRFPEKFSDSLRVIEFEGEGFFEVAKDHTRPFVIRSGKISTTVLGTSFNLRSRSTSEKFEVAVVSGSVKVSHIGVGDNLDERYLTPNQQAVFDNANNTFKIQGFDPEKVLAWVNGIVVFENSSLVEIKNKLENWYGVEIDISGLNRKISKGYTGNYKDKSLETVLDGISYVLDFKYEIKGKRVIIN